MSKLPKLYVNKKSSKSVNNEEVFYSKSDNVINNSYEGIDSNSVINNLLIQKKINDIFNSPNFVYKVNVIITLKDGKREETLIAKTTDNVLTIDNETIAIKDILQISEK